jgi:hypothetical protein
MQLYNDQQLADQLLSPISLIQFIKLSVKFNSIKIERKLEI